MQAAKSTTQPRKSPARRRAATAQPLPAYNLADGTCSFRHTLTARERTALDRALDIVGRALTDGRQRTTASPRQC